MAEQKQGPSKEQRHEAWSKALDHMLKADMTWAEKAALVLVVAERDDEDNETTVADMRAVLERGLRSLTERGALKLERGQYRLVTERAEAPKAMAVDAEKPAVETKAEAGDVPEIA